MDSNLFGSNNTGDQNSAPVSLKEMFKRPGGTFAKITAVGAALGLGYLFTKALPFLVAAAANTLVLILEIVAIVGILAVLFNKNTWKWISLFWLHINRKIVGMFVKIDPISILENSIHKMKDKLNTVHENVTKLRTILVSMNSKLDSYQSQQEDNIRKLKKRKEQLAGSSNLTSNEKLKIQMSISNLSNDIAQLDSIIESQKKRIETSKKYQEVMERLETIAEAKVERSSLELKRTKDAYESAKEQRSALKTISSIMRGDSQSLEEEMAIEHITNTINSSVAEMEGFINDSDGVLENYNLESAVNEDRVEEILKKYGQKDSFSSFSEESKIDNSSFGTVKEKEKVEVNKWC
ncbi:MAG: hypothetical protein J6Y22_09565 [Paludibacteraceae bacterium]|nr:hypothetical protein [Paludibacteraceae bacterium]